MITSEQSLSRARALFECEETKSTFPPSVVGLSEVNGNNDAQGFQLGEIISKFLIFNV